MDPDRSLSEQHPVDAHLGIGEGKGRRDDRARIRATELSQVDLTVFGHERDEALAVAVERVYAHARPRKILFGGSELLEACLCRSVTQECGDVLHLARPHGSPAYPATVKGGRPFSYKSSRETH